MLLDWECPNCKEKHINKIKKVQIGDRFTLTCTDCDITTNFAVTEQKFHLTYESQEGYISSENAVAWE